MIEPNYTYKAKVVNVHDGDTYTVDIDLGFHVSFRCNIRLDGVNCPELNTSEGDKAQEYVMKFMRLEPDIIIQTTREFSRSFERYVAKVYVPGIELEFGQHLVDAGYAKVWTKNEKTR